MSYRPTRPSGDTAEARFMQAVWDALWGGKFPFIDKPGCQWNRTTRGYWPNIKASASGGGGVWMYFKGEFDNTLTYQYQECVVVRGGVNAGLYLSLVDNNTDDTPWSSANWTQLAPGDTVGKWT